MRLGAGQGISLTYPATWTSSGLRVRVHWSRLPSTWKRVVALQRSEIAGPRRAYALDQRCKPGAPETERVFFRFCARFSSVSRPPSTVMRSSYGELHVFLDAVRPAIRERALQHERRLEQRAVPGFDNRACARSTDPSICISSATVNVAAPEAAGTRATAEARAYPRPSSQKS